MNETFIQLLNSIVYSMLLFMMASGLSLIFGQLNFINLSHGSFYVLGGYVAYSILSYSKSFLLSIIIAPLIVGLFGVILEYVFLRRLYGHKRHLDQVLFSMGIALITADIVTMNWGTYVINIRTPSILSTAILILDTEFPLYRIVIILVGLCTAISLWTLIYKTHLGTILRAGVFDIKMVSESGINVQPIFTSIFGLGAALAALAGAMGAPLHSLYPGLQFEILILTLAVVIIGGIGTLKGAFMGSLLIGTVDTFGKALFPEISLFLIFALMVIILIMKPSGLFGNTYHYES